MRRRGIFKRVAKHMLAQDKQSLNGSDCAYKSPEGLKCAVGCLINDENYTEALENIPADQPQIRKAVSDSIGQPVGSQDAEWLTELQHIHDYDPPTDWKWLLNSFAEKHFNGKDLYDLGVIE